MVVSTKKKRGKNASFFINPIAQDSKKNDEPENVEKTHKSLNHPKQLKNWNVLLTKFLEIFKT